MVAKFIDVAGFGREAGGRGGGGEGGGRGLVIIAAIIPMHPQKMRTI
jgi:hypothetical protein